MAFLLAGLPNLLLALIVAFVIKEPRNDARLITAANFQFETTVEAARKLFQKPAFIFILIALTLYGIVAYGALVFVAPFTIRAYHLSLMQVGGIFGASGALSAVVGNLGGGFLTDKLVKKNIRVICWSPGVCLFGCWPFLIAAFSAPSFPMMLALYTLGMTLLNAAIPSMYASLHLYQAPKFLTRTGFPNRTNSAPSSLLRGEADACLGPSRRL